MIVDTIFVVKILNGIAYWLLYIKVHYKFIASNVLYMSNMSLAGGVETIPDYFNY